MNGNALRFWLFAALVVAALLALAACNEEDDGTGDDGGTTPQATEPATGSPAPAGEIVSPEDILRKDGTATEQGEVVWGWMFEQSGALAGFGEPAGDGVLMAVEEINDAGGFQVGDTVYTIRLVPHDTRSDIPNTIAVGTELIRDDGVKVIWGPAAVGDVEATQITQPQDVIHICPCPTRELTSLSSEEKATGESHFAFQTLPAPSKFLPPGALNLAQEHPEYDTFATICVNSQEGHAFCDFFTDAYEAAGFEHAGEQFFPAGTTNFDPFITRLGRSDPDIILNFTDAGLAQFSLLKSSWQLDVGDYYIAVALPYDLFESLVGEGIRNKLVSAGAAPRTHADYTSLKAREFFDVKYPAFKGGDALPAGAFAAMLTYDPAYMLVAAMQQADTVDDVSAIVDALEQVHFNGYGENDLYFDARHIIVAGNDSCNVYQGEMTCVHHAPPDEE